MDRDVQGRLRSGVGLGDLVDLYRIFGEKGVDAAARCLGYEPVSPRVISGKVGTATAVEGDVTSEVPASVAEPESERPKARFWYLKSREEKEDAKPPDQVPEWYAHAGEITRDWVKQGVQPRAKIPHRPLIPWARLWPFLKQVLARLFEGRELDIPRVVDQMARLRSIEQLPRRKIRTWASRVEIVLDGHPEMAPYLSDRFQVVNGLGRIMGKRRVWVTDQTPLTRAWCHGAGMSRPFPMPPPGTRILVFSSLGCFGQDKGRMGEWEAWGKKLRLGGISPVVLTPAPPHTWTPGLARAFSLVFWDTSRLLPKMRPSGLRGQQPEPPPPGHQKRMEELRALISPAFSLSPALVRAIRSLFPHGKFNGGDEGLLWSDKDHIVSHASACALKPGLRREALSEFKTCVDSDRARAEQIFDLISLHHRHFCPSIQNEEKLIRAMLMDEPLPGGGQFMEALVKTLEDSDYGSTISYKSFCHGFESRMAPLAPLGLGIGEEAMETLWVKLNREKMIQGEASLPPGLDPTQYAWLLDTHQAQREYQIVQQGPFLWFEPPWDLLPPMDRNSGGSPLGGLNSAVSLIKVEVENQSQGVPLVKSRVRVPGGTPDFPREIKITTDRETLVLATMEKPDWAWGMGRDSQGLFVEIGDEKASRRAYYLPQGGYGDQGDYSIETGGFYDAPGYREIMDKGMVRPDWAHAFGTDEYGIWAEFEFKGVSQRLRWMAPGEFLMGDEAKKDQHPVVITQGYWMADSPCTQAMWQAVMEKNSSRFKGKDRPVDSVSWKDCRRFLDRMNRAKPGLELTLPTEAQWEYACRSKSEVRSGQYSAYAFGNKINKKQVNYDSKQTLPVKKLPPNDRGLHQMHGNVWEWCRDWYGKYPGDTAVDPVGPDDGAFRVLRGGSWIHNAGSCRSASRFRFEPAFRLNGIGFRFSRGQTGRGQAGSGDGAPDREVR